MKNGLRKIIANNSAGIIFNMLNLLDGTELSKTSCSYNEWTGIKLVDEEPNKNREEFLDTLHDCFFETYWEWKKNQGNKDWKLDTIIEG